MRIINGKEYPDSLRGANLRDADLSRANLRDADLRDADLRDAILSDAILSDADLRDAILSDAILSRANLRDANLRRANLRDADLSRANLRDAILSDANLSGAILSGANLRETKGLAQTYVAGEGDLIVYKKLRYDVVCKLLIPASAKRSNGTTRKCRAEYAVVLEGEGVSQYDEAFVYRVGETVRPRKPFCDDRWNECASGIHFFITREEADDY